MIATQSKKINSDNAEEQIKDFWKSKKNLN